MTIIGLIFTLVIVGVILGLINRVIPMPDWVKICLNAIVGIWLLVYLLHGFGVMGQTVYVR